MRVAVDDARCVGHGRCYALAPAVFDADEHGHCVVVRSEVHGELADLARRAADNCPESAITCHDDPTGAV